MIFGNMIPENLISFRETKAYKLDLHVNAALK